MVEEVCSMSCSCGEPLSFSMLSRGSAEKLQAWARNNQISSPVLKELEIWWGVMTPLSFLGTCLSTNIKVSEVKQCLKGCVKPEPSSPRFRNHIMLLSSNSGTAVRLAPYCKCIFLKPVGRGLTQAGEHLCTPPNTAHR